MFSLIINRKLIGIKHVIHTLCLGMCIMICGCGSKSEFSLLQKMIEKEDAYLSQEIFEEQLEVRLNEYFYYEGGTSYEAPLMVYEGEHLDYVVLHHYSLDSVEGGYTKYRVLVLVQPQDESLSTSMVELTVYNEAMYSLSFCGRLDERIDFEDSKSIEEGVSDLLGTSAKFEKVKMWYTGTLDVGACEQPQYSDFEEKEKRIAEICDWIENYLLLTEMGGDVDIYVRDFRKEDSSTEILIERTDEEIAYLLMSYYFYQENNFQRPLEMEGDCTAYIEKLKEMSVN